MTTSILLSAYKTFVLNRLDDTSFNSAYLTQFANDENRDICNAARWPFMITTAPQTVTVGVASYAYQSNCQDMIDLLVTDPDANEYPLHYIPFETFDRRYPDPSQLTKAPPTLWTTLGNTFIVGPAYPDKTYTLLQKYLKEPKTLAADTDTLDIPDAFAEVVTLGMLARAQMTNDQNDLATNSLNVRAQMLKQMKYRLTLPPSAEPVQLEWRQRPGFGHYWDDEIWPY